jgi:hypothetical protein
MVKMMLIQVQFLKRDVFKAMDALDEGTPGNVVRQTFAVLLSYSNLTPCSGGRQSP